MYGCVMNGCVCLHACVLSLSVSDLFGVLQPRQQVVDLSHIVLGHLQLLARLALPPLQLLGPSL